MVFVDVVRALYDYVPQSGEELAITDGDVLFVLEKSAEDAWWKCKKKAVSDDDEEPEGLVPNNYVERVEPVKRAKALYDYAQQTDEELSFDEGRVLEVFDESDPDWTLVGCGGEYGFAPAIYIEAAAAGGAGGAVSPPLASPPPQQRQLAPPPMPIRPSAHDDGPLPGEADYPDPGQAPSPVPDEPANNPAAALAGIIQQKTGGAQPTADRSLASPPLPNRPQYTPDESEEEEAPPPMPQRPQSQVMPSPPPTTYAQSPRSPRGAMPTSPTNRHVSATYEEDDVPSSPSGFRMYNIHEMVSHFGKNKKMPTVLGLNIAKGLVMIAPEKSRDGPSREWSAERLTHYSIEGKHVFVELVRPSKSVDFHAGSKDTAQEIVAHLGELAGASRAEGLREIYAASEGTSGGGMKKGKMLYEFMAQGDDEVSVAVDDEVLVLDDQKSEEWWMIRRLRSGKEGVVPASYVEITGTMPSGSVNGLASAKSMVEQNRLEEERLAKEAVKKDRTANSSAIPERLSSLAGDERRSSRSEGKSRSSRDQQKSKPNTARVRTWTDRSGTFKVEAEFIGLRDGKIHLHKLNGVKIAVPVSKMAVEDLEYVESATGKSLDDEKPLSDIKRRNTQKKTNGSRAASSAGASVQKPPAGDEYDWFDFFLSCGVNPQICERYANAFSKDQIGQEILPDVNEQLLRTLGLKEGDILRVMKTLDNKYDRKRGVESASPAVTGEGGEGLFSGPGGALRNNTRKGRPAPAVQTNDVVDEAAFRPQAGASAGGAKAAPSSRGTGGGFDDDAWDVKPARTGTPTQASAAQPSAPAPQPQPQPPSRAPNDDLSLLAMPLQPQPTAVQQLSQQPTPSSAPTPQSPPTAPQQPQQQQGADQALFDKIAALKPQPPRQRPAAPQQQQQADTGIPPPPRAASAPGFHPQQQQQMSGGAYAPPLQPQLTGYAPYGYPQQPQQQQPTGLQQSFPALQPQPTGMSFQPLSSFGMAAQQQHYGGFAPQPTGYPSQQQQFVNGAATGSPFADPLSHQQTQASQFYPQPTGFAPQQTGFPPQQQQQQTGYGPMTNYPPQQQQQQPQLPPQQTGGVLAPMQPLQPQKTGPPPPVRFGVPAQQQPLVPQATGRANLARATAQNPFGF
ncbi:hypothetical protein B0A50_08083 [Salinomyces thailandicus]|uniref:Actin cytoskeleton-regulatory complex protein SLA1 n=1 Tax=Salinomyces thailandicus TaxID=706561 RepID=A0A4U0TLE6_9PEZI|nr:hypothetical protein B0A50_08083 [Salinomyces thailandica]